MNGWLRVGVVMSAFWVAIVVSTFLIALFFHYPSNCLMENGEPAFIDLFFSCDPYANLIPGERQRFFSEINFFSFSAALMLPLLFAWVVTYSVVWSWKWIAKGFREY